VTGLVNYNKLIQEFGCEEIAPALLSRIESLSKVPLHPFLKRGIFYSHKDLDTVLEEYEQGRPFYLYTGRGPSSASMHLGHLLPFLFTKYLQDAFNVPLVIQMTDDEKYLFRDMDLPQIRHNLIENCKDIIACGFDVKKTFIFSNFDYMGSLYPNVVKIQRHVTNNQVRGLFGVTMSDNIGRTAFPAIQAAPSFQSSFPVVFKHSKTNRRCLIPMGIDQDPYFRMTRDIADKINELKPALLHSKFFPPLQGMGKMSASVKESAIFLTDTQQEIKAKILKTFSGGKYTKEEHRRLGADLSVDVAYNYLSFFLEDDKEMNEITTKYGSGEMLTIKVKKRCIKILTDIVKKHQQARSNVTNAVVQEFMSVRPLELDCLP